MEFNYIPLFSSIVAIYTLILLYFPSFFLTILLSPVLNTTMIILISLLRLGVNQRSRKENSFQNSRILDSVYLESGFLIDPIKNRTHVESKAKMDLNPKSNVDYEQIHTKSKHELGSEYNISKNDHLDANFIELSQVVNEENARIEKGSKKVDTIMKILEWNMKAPLEIIYEAYEGEEEEEENNNNNNKLDVGCEKYPFLLMYYPESETDSSSDGDFPTKEKWETRESVFLKWEEEEEGDDREELIEISLDRYDTKSFDFGHAEEDNFIEIDIFPTRN